MAVEASVSNRWTADRCELLIARFDIASAPSSSRVGETTICRRKHRTKRPNDANHAVDSDAERHLRACQPRRSTVEYAPQVVAAQPSIGAGVPTQSSGRCPRLRAAPAGIWGRRADDISPAPSTNRGATRPSVPSANTRQAVGVHPCSSPRSSPYMTLSRHWPARKWSRLLTPSRLNPAFSRLARRLQIPLEPDEEREV